MSSGDNDGGSTTGADSSGPAAAAPSRDRLTAVTFDKTSVRRANANVEHEREVAIFDILDAEKQRR